MARVRRSRAERTGAGGLPAHGAGVAGGGGVERCVRLRGRVVAGALFVSGQAAGGRAGGPLPFALPTAVSGIALTAIYSSGGWLGRRWSLPLAFTPAGGGGAYVRSACRSSSDRAAASRSGPEPRGGSAAVEHSPARTFVSVLLPALRRLADGLRGNVCARALGEVRLGGFISGNLPLRPKIAPLRCVAPRTVRLRGHADGAGVVRGRFLSDAVPGSTRWTALAKGRTRG